MAAELGASYVGVVFASGARRVTAEQAASTLAGAAGYEVERVGVFGPQDVGEIADAAVVAGLDTAQLHGDPDIGTIEALRKLWSGNVWAVLRVEGARLEPAPMASLLQAADAVVLDSKVAGRLGGTGVALEWDALRRAVDEARELAGGGGRVVLAGGLTPENVGRAVADLAPDVVDVASGVERSPGVKDHDRMRAFLEAARNS